MPSSFSLSHRSLNSTASSLHSLNDSMRTPYVPPEMATPMQYTNRYCNHSPTEMLPCARRILKTTKLDNAVTHTWVSCRGTRYVSTTLPLLHGVTEEQMAKDAALFGHTRDEAREFRASLQSASPKHVSRPPSLRTDSGTQSEGSDPSDLPRPQAALTRSPRPEATERGPSFASFRP